MSIPSPDKNAIDIEEENEHIKDEINKQINGIIINLPKLLNKITEYIKGKNKILEEEKFLIFAEKLRNINQKISEFLLDKKTSFQIGETIDNLSNLDYLFNPKESEENRNYYENFYDSSSNNINEEINSTEEFIKSFLNIVQIIFEEFNYLLFIICKNEIIIPYCTNHINKINNLFRSFSNDNIISNNNDYKSIIAQSKMPDIENMAMGTSLSDFKINIIESVDEFCNCKEAPISIDFIKLNAKKLDDLSFLKG